jgi:hypothetical protein
MNNVGRIIEEHVDFVDVCSIHTGREKEREWRGVGSQLIETATATDRVESLIVCVRLLTSDRLNVQLLEGELNLLVISSVLNVLGDCLSSYRSLRSSYHRSSVRSSVRTSNVGVRRGGRGGREVEREGETERGSSRKRTGREFGSAGLKSSELCGIEIRHD